MGNDGDNLNRPVPVTREEYEGLIQSIRRLTDRMDGHSKIWDKLIDRIEALEAKLKLDGPPGAQ